MQTKEKKGNNKLNGAATTQTDSCNNSRRLKRNSKGRGARSEGTLPPASFGSDVLKFSFRKKSFIEISELMTIRSIDSYYKDIDYIGIGEKLYKLLEHNPNFQPHKISFESTAPLSRVISQLLSQAKRIAKQSNVKFLAILNKDKYKDKDQLIFYIYRKHKSEESFHGVQLNFLCNMKEKEERIYPLLFDMISIFFNQRKVMFWNDYEEECVLNSIEERLEYEIESFEDDDHIAANKEILKYYHEGEPKEFTDLFFKNKVSIEDLEINHLKFIPSSPLEKDFHSLIGLGIEILKMPYTTADFSPEFFKYDFGDDRMLAPDQYLRFIWDYNDPLWNEVFQNIDATWQNSGQAPPISSRRLSDTNMSFELEKIDFPEKLEFFLKCFSDILFNHNLY